MEKIASSFPTEMKSSQHVASSHAKNPGDEEGNVEPRSLASFQSTIQATTVPYPKFGWKKSCGLGRYQRNTHEPTVPRIYEIEQCMKENIIFIHKRTKDCDRLTDEIHGKVGENDLIGDEVIRLIALEDTRVQVLEDQMEDAELQVGWVRDENLNFVEEFIEAWDYMTHVQGNLPRLTAGDG